MKYYVKLKDGHQLNYSMKERIIKLELGTYEKRFPIEEEVVEVYCLGSLEECQRFLDDIDDNDLKNQFEIVK